MPKPEEYGFIDFTPHLVIGTDEYQRAWQVINELGLTHVLQCTCGWGDIKSLGFQTKKQAIMFKLRF